MLVYQEHGGGALTRVADMLLAGVPVLANEHASRNWHGLRGIQSFTGIDELVQGALNLMAAAAPIVPPNQLHPPDSRPLLECFRKLLDTDPARDGQC